MVCLTCGSRDTSPLPGSRQQPWESVWPLSHQDTLKKQKEGDMCCRGCTQTHHAGYHVCKSNYSRKGRSPSLYQSAYNVWFCREQHTFNNRENRFFVANLKWLTNLQTFQPDKNLFPIIIATTENNVTILLITSSPFCFKVMWLQISYQLKY